MQRHMYVTHGEAGADGVDARVVAHVDRKSTIAEQYHVLQTHLYALIKDKKINSIVVTSSQPGEGKTLTCCNLAVSLASDIERKVLLVDCDLRKPNVHSLMGIGRSPGVTDIIAGKAKLADMLKSPAIDNLYILPAGSETSNISELLRHRETKELFERLKSSFDLIIIDTPPVMPVTDSRILGAISDMVLLVIRSQAVPKKLVKEAFFLLETSHAKPTACVLTDHHAPFYHYAAYPSYYGRSSPESKL